jgi:hypothetical protein
MTAIMTAKKKVVRSTARPAKVAAKKIVKLSAPRKVVKAAVAAVKLAKPARVPMKELASGQVWLVGDAHLKVEMIGKLLVHYKLAKPTAVRTPTSIAGISTLLKFMKKSKAVLIQG